VSLLQSHMEKKAVVGVEDVEDVEDDIEVDIGDLDDLYEWED